MLTIKSTVSDTTIPQHPLSKGECARILQDWCPACFGGHLYGRPWTQYVIDYPLLKCQIEFFYRGGDIHVSLDGNFNH